MLEIETIVSGKWIMSVILFYLCFLNILYIFEA